MESRFPAGVLLLGLVVIGFGLMIWFIRLSGYVRTEYRPPFALSGTFGFLRLDYYTDRGRTTIAKATCALALLSFVFVMASLLIGRLSPPDQAVRLGTPTLPADTLFFVASATFFCAALLAAFILMLAAALQLGWAKHSQSAKALRLNAARFAFYGVGAFLVAIAHVTLLRLGPGLLK